MKTRKRKRANPYAQWVVPTQDDVIRLAGMDGAECVSINLALSPPGTPVDANRLKLRQLVAVASADLDRRSAVHAQLEELSTLAESPEFWKTDATAIALFLGEVNEIFSLDDVPDDIAVVGTDYYVIPLLKTVQARGSFQVLSLTTDGGRLFQVDGPSVKLISEHVLPEWISPSKRLGTLQYHSEPSSKSGGPGVSYHGQSASEPKKRELTRRLKAIDDWLLGQAATGDGPLVLAGVEHVVAEFRATSKFGLFADFTICGGRLTDNDILQKSREFAIDNLRRQVAEIQDRFRTLHGTGKASADPDEILRASQAGSVDVLVVRSGSFDWEKEPEHTVRSDRLNTATREVVLHKGKVLVLTGVEMPDPYDMVAIYRY